jgi:predicted HTH transcriptional regulator
VSSSQPAAGVYDVLSREEIEAVLVQGYELRGFEMKGPGSRDDTHLLVQVARAALGMGNLRDGGHVIIGIDDGDPAAMLPGLEPEALASWVAYDDIARKLAEYADPPLRFDVAEVELSSGARVAAIQIFEFSDVPHICARDYPRVLRKGALYVRSRRAPETSEVPSSSDMRDLLELATEKALRSYIATLSRAGVALASEAPIPESDDDLYASERHRGWQ